MKRSWVTLLAVYVFCVGCSAAAFGNEELQTSSKTLGGFPSFVQRGSRTVRDVYTGQTDFDARAVKEIINQHNEFRSGVSPSASNMQYMTWDAELATMSQQWAEKCRFEHGNIGDPSTYPFDNIGQNIFYRGGEPDRPIPASDFVSFWHSEVSNFDYNSNNCTSGECGHYTQVVWATSRKVGCGLQFCDRIGGETNAWFVVCNYGPAGNFYGEIPFEAGEPCSQCDASAPFCYRNICHNCNPAKDSECRCTKTCKNCGTLDVDGCICSCAPGFIGPNCEETCRDKHEMCGQNPGWPDASFCGFDPAIPVGCPLMCGQCSLPDRDYQCANPGGSGPAPPGRVQPVPTQTKKKPSGSNPSPTQLKRKKKGKKGKKGNGRGKGKGKGKGKKGNKRN